VRHSAYERLIRDAKALRPIALVDSTFNFRPVGLRVEAAGAAALAAQLLDVLPHPLYTLVAALERAGGTAEPVRVVAVHAGPADLFAQLGAAGVAGRLAVSLRARPVSSTLTLAGAGGSLPADFVRGMVVGAGNAGTEPLEKVLNPLREAAQLAARSMKSAARRVLSGGDFLFPRNGGQDLTMVMYGVPGGPYELRVALQFRDADRRIWLVPNAGPGVVTPGRWHRIEWLVEYNSTSDPPDGVVRWWLDGVLVGDYRDVLFPAPLLVEHQLSPTWGGVGDVKAHEDFMWFDHVRISRR
jgi:hypothetical protein